ncbi:MmgE/PrpD family protein [Neorhizobium sp. LjRoot104]|uniref:MmgE/PrpD family protein n=1 Tax=Neorhizobium sp. LjRoot104 TaxID=3342254 RepID=UPI003ECC8038
MNDLGMLGRVVSYVEAARRISASDRAREAVFRCIIDLLGAAAAGVNQPGVRAVRSTALATMGAGGVPIWFSGASSTTIGAAWANSAAASALDLDDGHRLARGHPGAAVIPAAFAVAANTGASLDEIINAIVIGYEVGVAIGAARTSYGNTGTWSAYAVAATAAALRRTPSDILAHALAIAGESAPNQLFASAPTPRLPAPEGSDVKEGIPWSVVTGLIALNLAEAGHTGPRNILDSVRHYRFAEDFRLGADPHICKAYFKLYACCRHIHAPLDAMLQVIEQNAIDVSTIDLMEVETTNGALRISNRTRPVNIIDVQYSIPYCLALAALSGPQVLLPLMPDALGQEGVVKLAEKVNPSLNMDFDARFPAETPARVSIIADGRRFVSEVTTPKGEASNPLSWDELEAKFRAATRMVLSAARQEDVLKRIRTARAGDMSALMTSLVSS